MSQAPNTNPSSPDVGQTGSEGPTSQGSSRVPWIIAAAAILTALVAVALLLIQPGESGVAERGSATPEEAATLFAESFVDQDFETAASTFATESLFTNYSFADDVERMGVFSPNSAYLPAEHYEVPNLDQRRGQVGAALGNLARSALLPDVEPGQIYVFGSEDRDGLSSSEFVEALDPAGLAAFSVVRVDAIEPAPGSKFAEQTDVRKATLGAEDLRTVAVLFDTPDGPAMLGMEVSLYDGAWYVNLLFAPVLGTHGNALIPLSSEEEYADMVESAQQAVNAT